MIVLGKATTATLPPGGSEARRRGGLGAIKALPLVSLSRSNEKGPARLCWAFWSLLQFDCFNLCHESVTIV